MTFIWTLLVVFLAAPFVGAQVEEADADALQSALEELGVTPTNAAQVVQTYYINNCVTSDSGFETALVACERDDNNKLRKSFLFKKKRKKKRKRKRPTIRFSETMFFSLLKRTQTCIHIKCRHCGFKFGLFGRHQHALQRQND